MNHQPAQRGDREERLNDILAEWLEAAETGSTPDEDAFLQRYPEFADALRQHLDDWKRFPRVAATSAATPRPAATVFDDHDASRLAEPAAALNALIGDYEVLEELGRGGMGIVCKARHQTLNRLVALKMLRAAGPGVEPDLQRLRHEAEMVAALDHPHIVPLYEVGEHDGRLFLSMKLIEGGPLSARLAEFAADPRRATKLLATIAHAVHHAHQRGILHRDLKPSNILLDAAGQPNVTDFGLARKVEGHDELTLSGALVGTPGYMAPEQTLGRRDVVTTAADVYGLGAILYALLTGEAPFRGLSPLDVLKQVREREPEPPRRRNPRVARDLQTICLKCLDKEPQRRYGSARELAEDLERFLNHEPVQAQRPTLVSRLGKWARRHQAVALAASVGVVLALVVSCIAVVLLTAAYQEEALQRQAAETERALAQQEQTKAEQAQQREKDERQKAEQAAVKERQAREVAEERRKQAEAVATFLESLFRGLDPRAEQKDGPSLTEQLLAKLEEADSQLKEGALDPITQIRMQNALGVAYLGLGEAPKALSHLQCALEKVQARQGADHSDTLATMCNLASAYKAVGELDLAVQLQERALEKRQAKLGADHLDTVQSMNNLAVTYRAVGKFARAVELLEQTLQKREATLGPDHPDTLMTMNNLAGAYREAGQFDRAVQLHEQALEKQKVTLGPDHADTLTTMNNLALSYQAVGKLDLAVQLHEQTAERTKAKFGPDHPNTLNSINNLAKAYLAKSKFNQALPLFEQNLEKTKARLGADHPQTLNSMNNLAYAYRAMGKLNQAVQLYEKTLDKQKAKLGADHPNTLMTMHNLAYAYQAMGKREQAVLLFEQTLQKQKVKLGTDHPDTLNTMNCLGGAYYAMGKFDLAVPLYEQILQNRKAKPGPDHADMLATMNNLASAYQALGKLDRAVPLFEQSLQEHKARLGLDHPNTLFSMNNLAGAYETVGKLDRAVPLFEECLEKMKVQLGPDHPDTLNTMCNLALACTKQGEFAKAEPLLRTLVAAHTRAHGANHPATASALANLGSSLLQQRRYDEAETVLRDCLKIREQIQPAAWTTFNTKSQLGGSLLGQQRYTDAEPLLLQGYKGMKQRAATIPPQAKVRLVEALKHLVQLYETTAQEAEAAAWRQKLQDAKQNQPSPR
jgi:tetratricopeptide (TPR) repeat protein